jgi:hypothetical protein
VKIVGQTQETTVGLAYECNGGNQECVGMQNSGGETSIKAELVRLRRCWEDKIYFRDICYEDERWMKMSQIARFYVLTAMRMKM